MNTTPIEFMAWDGEQIIIPELGDWFFIGASSYLSLNNECDDIICDNLEGVCELMQLTALRSINDEPIYNHMIVKDNWGNYKIVDMYDYTKMYFMSKTKLEIVGNRFQYPELLELCK